MVTFVRFFFFFYVKERIVWSLNRKANHWVKITKTTFFFLNNWIIIVKKWNDKYIYLKNLIRKITIDQFELIIHLRFVRFFIILTYIYIIVIIMLSMLNFFFREFKFKWMYTRKKKKKKKKHDDFAFRNPRKTFIWNRTDLRFDPSPRFSLFLPLVLPQNATKIWKLFERDERSRRNCRIISEFVRFIETDTILF